MWASIEDLIAQNLTWAVTIRRMLLDVNEPGFGEDLEKNQIRFLRSRCHRAAFAVLLEDGEYIYGVCVHQAVSPAPAYILLHCKYYKHRMAAEPCTVQQFAEIAYRVLQEIEMQEHDLLSKP